MAYILPNFFPTIIHLRDSPPFPLSKPSSSFSYPHTKLDPPPARVAQLNQSPQVHDNKHSQKDDLPLLFTKDLNYHIYRDDITFVDPLNTFTGIEKYKMIFWALRFHGRILFREISMEVLRIWQPSENMILIRWNLRGVPRVPWEAKGHFQGTSRYKLDRTGKIYQHKVDNLAFNFPQPPKPAVSVLDLVAACPATPNPTFLWDPVDVYSSSWLELYRAVKETLDDENSLIPQDCFITCH